MVDEGLLQRMQRAVLARPSIVVTCAPSFMTARVRHELMRRAVDQHRAGAALALIAALLGAGQIEMLAQHVEQASSRARLEIALDAIDDQRDGDPVWDRHIC